MPAPLEVYNSSHQSLRCGPVSHGSPAQQTELDRPPSCLPRGGYEAASVRDRMHHIHLIDRNLSTSPSANIPLQAYSAPQLAAGHRFPMVRLFPCAIMDHRQNVSVICAQARSTSGNQMALLRHGVRLQGVFRRIYETLLEDGIVTEKQVHNDHHTSYFYCMLFTSQHVSDRCINLQKAPSLSSAQCMLKWAGACALRASQHGDATTGEICLLFIPPKLPTRLFCW